MVTIDGIEHRLAWGDQVIPYWDERPVTILLEVPAYAWRSIRTRIGSRTITLPPGAGRSIEYAAPPSGYARGAVGPIGQVKARGTTAAVTLVAISTIVLTATVLAVAAGIIGAIGKAFGAL